MWSIVRDHQPSGDVGDVDDPRITCSVTRFFGRVNLKLQILLFFFFLSRIFDISWEAFFSF